MLPLTNFNLKQLKLTYILFFLCNFCNLYIIILWIGYIESHSRWAKNIFTVDPKKITLKTEIFTVTKNMALIFHSKFYCTGEGRTGEGCIGVYTVHPLLCTPLPCTPLPCTPRWRYLPCTPLPCTVTPLYTAVEDPPLCKIWCSEN